MGHRSSWRGPGLLIAVAAGLLLPGLEVLQPLVRPGLMLLLFLSCVGASWRGAWTWHQIALVFSAQCLGLVAVLVLRPVDEHLAVAAWLCAVAPTATAAPAVAGLLGARVAWLAAAALFSNTATAFIIPSLLPSLIGSSEEMAVSNSMALAVALTVLPPLLLAAVMPLGGQRLMAGLRALRVTTYPLWLCVLAILLAGCRAELLAHPSPLGRLLLHAAIAGVLCLLSFGLGRLWGGRQLQLECGQALGHKNTVLMIWIGLAFVGGEAAMTAMCYVLWQNIFNAVQIMRYRQDPVSQSP